MVILANNMKTEQTQQTRLDKAKQLVRSGSVTILDQRLAKVNEYQVDSDLKTCTCADYVFRLEECKHIIAAKIQRQEMAFGVRIV